MCNDLEDIYVLRIRFRITDVTQSFHGGPVVYLKSPFSLRMVKMHGKVTGYNYPGSRQIEPWEFVL
jgi:hypothetical protein